MSDERKPHRSSAFGAPYGGVSTTATPIPGVLSLDVLKKSMEEAEKLLKRQQEEGKYVVLLPDGQCFASKDPGPLAALLLQKKFNTPSPILPNLDVFNIPLSSITKDPLTP